MIAAVVLAADFMNFTYHVSPCAQNVPIPFVMRNGTLSYVDKKTAASFDVRVDSVKRGSLASGERQAVVVLACEFPVGGTAAAYAFEEQNKTATLLGKVATANWGGDWGQGPTSIHVRFANNHLYVEQCKDDECTAKVQSTYALHDGKLVRIH
jgi:hypothetical protein